MFDQGYILSYKFDEDKVQGTIKIALKYDKGTKEPIIKKIQRISKPGLRKYASSDEMPRVLKRFGYRYRIDFPRSNDQQAGETR